MHNLLKKSISLTLILSVLFSFSLAPALAATEEGQCYHYNDANKMDMVMRCSDGQLIAEYVYDHTGKRIVKKNYVDGELHDTVTSWSDSYETTVLASNSAETSVSYYYANDELIAKKNSNGTKEYVQTDHLGSTGIITDQSGQKLEETTYEPYGQVKSGGDRNKYQYTGQEKDQETGLNYYDSRYYASYLQRYIQPDTWIPDVYDPQQLNRYAYANNNPLKYTDPSGHFAFLAIPLVVWVVGALAVTTYTATHQDQTKAAIKSGAELLSQAKTGAQNIIKQPQNTNNQKQQTQTGNTQQSKTGGGNTGSTPQRGGSQTGGQQGQAQQKSGSPEIKNWNPNRNPKQDRLINDGEKDSLKRGGVDIEELKGGKGASKYDLYRDKDGNIYQKPKGGKGDGEPLDLNIKDF